MVKTDIIIVNWNSGVQLKRLVDSLVAYHSNLVGSVVVVDNASTDRSLELIGSTAELPFVLHLIRNLDNEGFGTACNQGAKYCDSEFLLFLNPDARLFVNSLVIPLNYMALPESADIGVCGVQLLDESGQVSRSCARFPSATVIAAQALGLNKLPGLHALSHHMGDWDHMSTRDVDHLIGAFYLIRRGLFEALHGFDERFFVYLEDLDLSLRAHKAGWRSVYLASAQAFHAGGGTSQQVKAARLFYSLRSRLLYGFKHFSPLKAWTLLGLTLFVEPITRVVFSLLRGGSADAGNTLKGYGMLWRALPAILRGHGR